MEAAGFVVKIFSVMVFLLGEVKDGVKEGFFPLNSLRQRRSVLIGVW